MMPRAFVIRCFVFAGGAALLLGGCTTSLFNRTPPVVEEPTALELEQIPSSGVVVVGDLAGIWGMRPFKVESIALVTGLKNTGSDPPPDAQRDILIGEMLAHNVRNPSQVLASPKNSLALVRGYMPPGVRKGDRFDLEIMLPPRSETTSLAHGWLMPTRLKELAVLEGRLHTGHEYATAQGHVLVDALLEASNDAVALKRGRVLGGGVALKSRPLGLALRTGKQSVRNSQLIAVSVNRRFHMFDRANIKQGVAKALRDNYIELQVHPRYQSNLWRYVRVVSEVAVRESAADRVERMSSLQAQLLEPTSSSRAALKLEAIGTDAIDTLRAGLKSSNDEARFYAAEALAYLDQKEAAPVLGELIRIEPAFRWHALTALSAMDEMAAYDELAGLLHSDSAETRYGALRALQQRNGQDPLVKGEALGDHLMLYSIASNGPPLVHIARTRAAEIVVFGRDVALKLPLVLTTDSHLTLKSTEDGQIRITQFAPGQDDRHAIASTRVDDVIRKLIAVGANYPEVVSILQQAKMRGQLEARIVVDALPKPGRTYLRPAGEGEENSSVEVASPLPSLFSRWEEKDAVTEEAAPPGDAETDDEIVPEIDEAEKSWWNIFGRMGG
jgi:flagellar basal body P-ring protein FlgI